MRKRNICCKYAAFRLHFTVTTNIMYVQGIDNYIADTLSRINEVVMPTNINSEELAREQARGTELHNTYPSLQVAQSNYLHWLTMIVYSDAQKSLQWWICQLIPSQECFMQHGFSFSLSLPHKNRPRQFEASLFTCLTHILGTRCCRTTPYGMVIVIVRTDLKPYLIHSILSILTFSLPSKLKLRKAFPFLTLCTL